MKKYLMFLPVIAMMIFFGACTAKGDEPTPNESELGVSETTVPSVPDESKAIDQESTPPEVGPLYKKIEPRSLQKETDLEGICIVVPTGKEWRQAGEQIATLIHEKWGVKASVITSDASQFETDWEENTLVIGHLGNNAHIAKLYSLYLAYTDAVHPGKGGYQLQTIIDPFGLGGNTILFGVSDPEGLEKGLKRFKVILDDLTQPKLPWLSESKMSLDALKSLMSSGYDTGTTTEKVDQLISKLDPDNTGEAASNSIVALMNRIVQYGQLYQLTCNDTYGRVYRYALKAYANFLNNNPSTALAQLSSIRNMWTTGYPFIASYNVMEASPLFDETDRKQIVSAFYLTYEANSHDPYLNTAPATGARYNHDIFPALSVMFGSSYFNRYYDLPETKGWYDMGERIFKGNTSNINLDEGSDYLMHVPTVTLEYALATGDHRFLVKGLRPSADLYVMMIDNLGTMSGGGDVYPFGRSSAYSWDHSQVLNAASWIFNDPSYRIMLERAKMGPFDGQKMPDLDFPFHRYLADESAGSEITGEHPMVQAYPVEKGVYDDLFKDDPGQVLDVAIENAFHKLAFRKGYDNEDSYLMLDGFSAGRHGHMDGNTIIKYSANGRIFIDDRDYIENSPKYHTGLLVIQDGKQEAKPPLTALEWAADAGGTGISKSTIPNYNGTDWTRTIINPGGRFFIIYDDLLVNKEGKYIFENTWQTLGDAKIQDDGFQVSQQGVTMRLLSLDETDLLEYERYGHFIKYWKASYPYPYADEEHVLREVKNEREYEEGDSSRFINVLSSAKEDELSVNAKRLDDQTVFIEDDGQQWYAFWGNISTENFESDGKFHLVSNEEILAVEVTQARVGNKEFKFHEAVIMKVDVTKGTWEAFGLVGGLTRYDDDGNPIGVHANERGSLSIDKEMIEEIQQAFNSRGEGTLLKNPDDQTINFIDRWTLEMDFEKIITASSKADVDGDGHFDLLLGGANGIVQVINAEGELMWTYSGRGRVNEVTCQLVNGEPVVFIATEDWFVYVIDSPGNELWRVLIPNDSARRESKGNLLGVTNVKVAHINGQDEDPWIMVGTQFRYIYGYNLSGQKVYEDIGYWYGIEDTAFLDLNGDGKDEGVIALEYYYYNILDNGTLLRFGGTKFPGPGFKVVEGLDSWSGGDGAMAVYGTKQNRVHLIIHDGNYKELWYLNVGGEVNEILPGDFDNDGVAEILVASDGFYLYCINPNGLARWKTMLGDRVLKVDTVKTKDGVNYLAVTDNGTLYQLNADGKIISKDVFDGLIQDVHGGTKAGEAWVVLEDGRVYKMK